LVPVDDLAAHVERSFEHSSCRLDVSVCEQFADPARRHTPLGIFKENVADDIDGEVVCRAEFTQHLGSACSPVPESEVAAHEYRRHAQRADEDVADEVLRGERRKRLVERQHQGRVKPQLAEQFQLAIDGDHVLRARLRTKQRQWIAVEGDGYRPRVRCRGILLQPLDDRTVARMHAVELAYGDGGAPEVCRHFGRIAEDDHGATSWGRFLRSHQMPNNGSTSGMKTYPRPKTDQTESCWNSSGRTRLSVPTTSTPANSKMIATHATAYHPRRPARTRASVARM